MKTVFCVVHPAMLDSYVRALLVPLQSLKRCTHAALFFFSILVPALYLSAQDITVKNPSLEGVRGQGNAPLSWSTASGTPDIQPGTFNINLPASDGHTYVGLHSGPLEGEGIALEVAMKGGRSYALSFDLAYTSFYYYNACYGNMAIYGGDMPGDSTELLWKSGAFYHTNWKRYNVVINPSRNYKYISFWADAAIPCEKSTYGSVTLLDNLSATLREIPQIILTVQHTCKGVNTGIATAKLISGTSSDTYFWKPGGQTTSHIDNLAAGDYEVTITSANGAMATAGVTIRETDLRGEVKTISSACNGDEQNQIVINTAGGVPPYRYYLNGASYPSYTPAFKALHPGNYTVVVKDDDGCEDKLKNIQLSEPPLLRIRAVSTTDVSCNETTDGKIALAIAGGTMPYSYRLEQDNWQTDSVWKQLNTGRYYFEIKDSNNCLVRGTADIFKNQRDCAVFVPTAFSPNGDGQNDQFRAKVHDDISQYRMVVYNRWGTLVFQSIDPEAAWDGGQQPTGNYVWMLTYTDSKKQARKERGNLLLIR